MQPQIRTLEQQVSSTTNLVPCFLPKTGVIFSRFSMRVLRFLLAVCLFAFLSGVVVLAQSSGSATSAPVWLFRSPSNVPTPRSYVTMTYDAVSQKVILFGGYNGRSYLNRTWTYDGTTWRRVFTPLAPSPRANAQMAYDQVSRKVVLFGGYNGTSYLRDTWLWDGATSKWTQAAPAHSPPAVTGPMLFTDPNGKVDEFGGYDGSRYQGTMWRWTGTDWRRLQLPMLPYARSSAAVGFNPLLNQVVMFGGL